MCFSVIGQCYIQCFFSKLCFKCSFVDCFVMFVKCIFDGCFGQIDCGIGSFFFFGWQFVEVFEKFSDLFVFVEEMGFYLFQCIGVSNGSKSYLGFVNDLIEIIYRCLFIKLLIKKEVCVFFFYLCFCLGVELCFGLCSQSSKCWLIENSQISQNFVVDFDIGFFQIIYEGVVFYIQFVSCCIDMSNLQSVELVFVLMMVMVLVLIGFYYCLFGDVIYVFVMIVVIFGLNENFFVMCVCCYIMFNFRYLLFFYVQGSMVWIEVVLCVLILIELCRWCFILVVFLVRM